MSALFTGLNSDTSAGRIKPRCHEAVRMSGMGQCVGSRTGASSCSGGGVDQQHNALDE